MSFTITISFHGGGSSDSAQAADDPGGELDSAAQKKKQKPWNNLHSYPGDAKLLDNSGVTLDELRGFTLGPNGNLYVVVGHKGADSNVLSFTPPTQAGGQYTSGTAFASPASTLSHPFALVFAGPSLYVSNQDSNEITQYDSTGANGQAFVSGFQELRGLAWDGTYLYAADEQGTAGQPGTAGPGAVSWYDSSGALQGSIAVIDPVHIVYDGSRYIYIGSESQNGVYLFDTQNKSNAVTQLALPTSTSDTKQTLAIDKTSGLAIVPDGGNTYLLVASRKGMQVNQYTLDTSDPPTVTAGVIFVQDLSDNPEFVSALGVSGAVSG